MTIIDAHHHLWDLDVRDQEWIEGPELAPLRRSFLHHDLEAEAREAGVSATVLVQTVTVVEETPEFLTLAAASDLIGAVVGWTDLTSPGIADELARLRSLPGGGFLRGIRHQVQGEADPDWLTRPEVLRGLRAVAAAGLVYDLLVLPHQLPHGRHGRQRQSPVSPSSSTTWASPRSPRANWSRGPGGYASWPRCRTRCASSPGWRPRPTGGRGPSGTSGRTPTPCRTPSDPGGSCSAPTGR